MTSHWPEWRDWSCWYRASQCFSQFIFVKAQLTRLHHRNSLHSASLRSLLPIHSAAQTTDRPLSLKHHQKEGSEPPLQDLPHAQTPTLPPRTRNALIGMKSSCLARSAGSTRVDYSCLHCPSISASFLLLVLSSWALDRILMLVVVRHLRRQPGSLPSPLPMYWTPAMDSCIVNGLLYWLDLSLLTSLAVLLPIWVILLGSKTWYVKWIKTLRSDWLNVHVRIFASLP